MHNHSRLLRMDFTGASNLSPHAIMNSTGASSEYSIVLLECRHHSWKEFLSRCYACSELYHAAMRCARMATICILRESLRPLWPLPWPEGSDPATLVIGDSLILPCGPGSLVCLVRCPSQLPSTVRM